MQARRRGLFNCFLISYSKDCELIVQFNVKFTYFCDVAYAATGVRFDDAGPLEQY